MLRLVIMRGLPGSGKSTLALSLPKEGEKHVILSTDDYFMEDGKYNFNAVKLSYAHLWNLNRALMCMLEKVSLIIIDNTNTCAWECAKYVQAGVLAGYEVEFREPETEWAFDAQECFKRNRHGVPMDSILKMLSRWEKEISVEKCLTI